MRPYLARVEQEWIALGRNRLAGRKRSILSLVTLFAPMFPDQKEAMAQAIEGEFGEGGKIRSPAPGEPDRDPKGRKPAVGIDREARVGEETCIMGRCPMLRAPSLKRCYDHLKKHRDAVRRYNVKQRQRSA